MTLGLRPVVEESHRLDPELCLEPFVTGTKTLTASDPVRVGPEVSSAVTNAPRGPVYSFARGTS